MKKILRKILTAIALITTAHLTAQECSILPMGNIIESIGPSPNGEVFTPKGDLKVLTIFAGFDDGPQGFNEDQPLSDWGTSVISDPILAIPTSLMTNPDKWMYSSLSSFGNNEYNLSEYYYQMSVNQFRMYGDILKDPNTNQFVRIDIDPTGTNGWSSCNQKVIAKMQQLYPNFDWSPYDNRTNKPNFQFDNSVSTPDFKPDYVVIIYRYSNQWGVNGNPGNQPVSGMNTWTGSSGAYSVLNGTGSINYNGYTFDGAGFTFPAGSNAANNIQLFIHELAHELYSCPHQSSVNGVVGEHWNFASSGWGMITNTIKINQSANAWDRWMLGWINLTTGVNQDNTNLLSSLDLTNNGIYTLRDFVTTGDAVRIKIPNTTDQYLWLENHQSQSIFDFKPWEGKNPSPNGEIIPAMSKGLYMYKESIQGDRNNVSTVMLYDVSKVNGIKLLNGNGNFDYDRSEFGIIDPSWYWGNPIFNFKRGVENPIEGCSNYQNYPDDYPIPITSGSSNGGITYSGDFNIGSYEAYPILRENNGVNDVTTYAHIGGVNTEASSQLGRRTDAFITGDEVGLSGIVPAFNYPNYNTSTAKKDPYFINGLSVKVISENIITGEITVQINFDNYDLKVNKRWTGNLSLPQNPNGSSLYSLNIKNNIVLTLDKSNTANRHTINTNNSPLDFINNTEFTCQSGSYFHLENNATITIGNSSKFILKSGSKLELEDGAELLIYDGELIIEDGAELILHNGAKLIIENQGILTNNNTITGKGLIVGDNTIATGNQAEVEIKGTLTFAPTAIWEHKNAGFYNFHFNHVLNLPASVSVTFEGMGKTVKNLEIQSSTLLDFNGNTIIFSLGLIKYGFDSKIKLTSANFRGTNVTFDALSTTQNSIGLEIESPQFLLVNYCDFNYFDKALKVSNSTSSLLLLASNYYNNNTAIDLDNINFTTIGANFITGVINGIKANNCGVIRVSGTEITGFSQGVLLDNVQGAYFMNSNINYNATGINADNSLVFIRQGTEIHLNTIGVEIYGSYDYIQSNYTSLLTIGDVGCGSVYNNSNKGIYGRDFILNIDAEQHAINNNNPNSVIPNRFDNNSMYAFDMCYSDQSVAPSQIDALGNYWGTTSGNISSNNYRIKTNTDCIAKPNLGTNILLITTSFSTCIPTSSCLGCNTSPGGGGSPTPPPPATFSVRSSFGSANTAFVLEDKPSTRQSFIDLSAIELIKNVNNDSWTGRSINNVIIPLEKESVHRIQVSKAIKAASANSNARLATLPKDIFEGIIIEEHETFNFNIYPNPAFGIVNIDSENLGEFNYLIYNVLGEIILQGIFTKNIQIDTKELRGVYFLKINSEKGMESIQKIMIN